MKIFAQFLLYGIVLQALATTLLGLWFCALLLFRTKAMFGVLILCAAFKLLQSNPASGLSIITVIAALTIVLATAKKNASTDKIAILCIDGPEQEA